MRRAALCLPFPWGVHDELTETLPRTGAVLIHDAPSLLLFPQPPICPGAPCCALVLCACAYVCYAVRCTVDGMHTIGTATAGDGELTFNTLLYLFYYHCMERCSLALASEASRCWKVVDSILVLS